METLSIAEKKTNINWHFDPEADVLYISIAEPKNALGVDIGEGVVSRIDPETNEVVGVTVIGFSKKTLAGI